MPEILKLPFAIQVALGSGFMAYMIAYAGIRQHHGATDGAFRSIAFGLIATAVLTWAPAYRIWTPIAAVVATLLAGVLWRWKLMAIIQSLLRTTSISWSDDIPTAWLSVTALRTDLRLSQIAVDLENGRVLTCDDTRPFGDSPFGPCTLGLDGSVAMYVTAERRPDGEWIDSADVFDPVDGARLTYLPASSIKRVELRYWTKATATVGAVAGLAADAAAAAAGSAAE